MNVCIDKSVRYVWRYDGKTDLLSFFDNCEKSVCQGNICSLRCTSSQHYLHIQVFEQQAHFILERRMQHITKWHIISSNHASQSQVDIKQHARRTCRHNSSSANYHNWTVSMKASKISRLTVASITHKFQTKISKGNSARFETDLASVLQS